MYSFYSQKKSDPGTNSKTLPDIILTIISDPLFSHNVHKTGEIGGLLCEVTYLYRSNITLIFEILKIVEAVRVHITLHFQARIFSYTQSRTATRDPIKSRFEFCL